MSWDHGFDRSSSLSPPLIFNLAHLNGGKSQKPGFGAKVGALLRFKRGVRRAPAPQPPTDIPHAQSLPPPMIPPLDPPPRATPRAWWHQFTLGKPPPRRAPFEGPYRGPFFHNNPSNPTHPRAQQQLTPPIIQSSGNLSKTVCNTPVSKYPQQMPTAISTSGATSLSSSQSGPSPSPASCSLLTSRSGLYLKENGPCLLLRPSLTAHSVVL